MNNFFTLSSPYKDFNKQKEFYAFIENSIDIRSYRYMPSKLKPKKGNTKFKLSGITFTNFSFSFTKISNIIFHNCTFKECLFIGAKFTDCEFHNSTFENVNPYKATFNEVYVNPNSFSKAIPDFDNSKANIATYFFKELYNNSIQMSQSRFANIAQYQFKNWSDKHLKYKYTHKKPYAIEWKDYWFQYWFNYLYKLAFGYGLRIRNFFRNFLNTIFPLLRN